MNTTVRIKASQIYKDWHVIDAAGRPLGRVATEAATLLRGKHKPTYEPHLDDGDFVIVINAGQVRVTGNKAEQNRYYTHSGYPGGLKTRTYTEQFNRFPERVIEKAVWGMLPGGTLGESMLKHLKVYKGSHHPHQSQITGSERARAARVEAQLAVVTEPMKAPRLRPLSVPVLPPEPVAKVAPEPKPAAPAKPGRTRAKAAPEAAESPAEADDIVTTAGVTQPEAAIAEPTSVEAAAEAPKPRARRKAAEPTADAESTTDAKPARKRATPKTEE
jgi:large subunit ribosomal protein L13